MNQPTGDRRPLTPVQRRVLGRLAGFTGLMTAGVVTTALGRELGWLWSLLWGLGAGGFAALVFAGWFWWNEGRKGPPADGPDPSSDPRPSGRRTGRRT